MREDDAEVGMSFACLLLLSYQLSHRRYLRLGLFSCRCSPSILVLSPPSSYLVVALLSLTLLSLVGRSPSCSSLSSPAHLSLSCRCSPALSVSFTLYLFAIVSLYFVLAVINNVKHSSIDVSL
jgi:hypothetical protein